MTVSPPPQNGPAQQPQVPLHPPAQQQYAQQYSNAPHPQPQPQPGVPAGAGFIQFTTQGSFMTSSFVPPTLRINGYQVTVPNFGTTTIPLPPGPTIIEAHMTWIWGAYGRAGLQCQVQPGQTVPVYYAPPLTGWSPGAIGVEPQQRQGLVAYLLLLGIPILVIVAILGVMFTALFLLN